MLGILLSVLAWFLSPFAVLTLAVGFLAFIASPVVSKKAANLHLWLSQFAMRRAAIVLGAHGDIYHKRMDFDDLGVEKIRFGNELKLFEDPDDSISTWLSGKFALADEIHGVLFTPYHAAVGERKHESEENGEMTVRATDNEYSSYGVSAWVKGVFELPKKPELVNLSHARHLIAGGERSEWAERIVEYYKNSREPYADRSNVMRLFLPVIAFLAVLGGMYLIADQMSLGAVGGGGGGPTESVSYGNGTAPPKSTPINGTNATGAALFLLITGMSVADAKDRLKAVNWKRFAKIVLFVTVTVAIVAGLTQLLGIVLAGAVTATFLMGFFTLPFLTMLARPSNRISGALGGLYLKLGLTGYTRPVWKYGELGYSLHEHSELDNTANTSWYSLKGNMVGFTYDGDPDKFPEALEAKDVENKSEVAADGAGATNVPANYVRSEAFDRAKYGGFVPKRPKSDKWYVAAGRAMKRLAGAAEGGKSQKRLEWAKEEYGVGGWKMSDKTLALITFGSIVLAAIIGTFVFFL